MMAGINVPSPQPAPSAAYTYMTVIPGANVGKVAVPDKYILPTQGKQRYRAVSEGAGGGSGKHGSKDFSLCIKSQSGTCRMGDQCHQLHIDPSFFADTDFWQKVKHTCCIEHQDFCTREPRDRDRILSRCFVVTGSPASSQPVPVDSRLFGKSLGLEKLLGDGTAHVVEVPFRQLCRLHGGDDCRFGGDCGRVHICRKFAADHLHTSPPAPKPNPAKPQPRAPTSPPCTGASPAGGLPSPPVAPCCDRAHDIPHPDAPFVLPSALRTPPMVPGTSAGIMNRSKKPEDSPASSAHSSVESSPGHVSPVEATPDPAIRELRNRNRAKTQPVTSPRAGAGGIDPPARRGASGPGGLGAPVGALGGGCDILAALTQEKAAASPGPSLEPLRGGSSRAIQGNPTEEEVRRFREALRVLIATTRPTPPTPPNRPPTRGGTPPPRF